MHPGNNLHLVFICLSLYIFLFRIYLSFFCHVMAYLLRYIYDPL